MFFGFSFLFTNIFNSNVIKQHLQLIKSALCGKIKKKENFIDFVITEVNSIGDKLSLLAMCNVYLDGKDVVIVKTKGKVE